MRISFNPAIMTMKPVQPIHRVVRQKRSLTADPVESEPAPPLPVSTSLSPLAVQKSREDRINGGQYEDTPEKNHKKNPNKNPLWNAMLNLS